MARMATSSIHIDADPEAVFDVLADPRTFAHWVVGAREIRGADPAWPAVGTHFDHAVGAGPLRVEDSTEVEEVRRPELLQLRARARPVGTARVRIELEPEGGGTRVTLREHGADPLTAILFMPLTHLLVRARNARSLERLKRLAEGTEPRPAGEVPSRDQARAGEGETVTAPQGGSRRGGLAAIGYGLLAGAAGSVAMSVSTNAEMWARGRPPSRAPAHALERLLGRRAVRRIGEVRLVTAAHVATGLGLGGVRGLLTGAGVGDPAARPAFLALTLTPDVAAMPALGAAPAPWRWRAADWGVTLLHHGVYAAATEAAFAALRRRGGR